MNSKHTKRALLGSLTSLVLCFAMLIGSTFAWFTDTASTSVNKIQAGTLDVELRLKTSEQGEYVNIGDEKTPIFGTASLAQNDNAATLWEPGKTQVAYLAVKNNGNLDLQYKVCLNVENVSKDLYKAMKYAITPDAQFGGVTSWTSGNSVNVGAQDVSAAVKLEAGATHYFALSIHMDEAAGNEYQGGQANFDLTVYATQIASESDSFDNTYDAGAKLPTAAANAAAVDEMLASAANGTAVIALPANTEYNLTSGVLHNTNGTEITFVGDGTQTVDVISGAQSAEGGMLSYQRGASFTFENLTIEAGEGAFDGIVCDELTFINCTITGKLTLYGKATFINCTFDNTMADQYSIWTWGGTDVKFEGCTFNTNGKAILLYGNGPTNLTVNNCIFTDRNNGTVGKAAIEVGNDYNATYVLTATNNTVYGYAINTVGAPTGTKMYGNKNSMDAEHLQVTVSNNTEIDGNATLVSTAAELKSALNNYTNGTTVTAVLTNDIDMSGWTALNGGTNHAYFVLCGNGYALKGQTAPLFSSFPAKDFTVKDVTFKNANISTTGDNYAGVIVGEMCSSGGGTYVIENCDIVDSSIKAYKYAGGFIGFAAQPVGGSTGSLTITDCAVTNSTFETEDSSCGSLIGHTWMTTVSISGCSVSGGSVKCTEAASGDAKAGALIGTVSAGTVTFSDCSANTIVTNDAQKTAPVNAFVGRNYGTVNVIS